MAGKLEVLDPRGQAPKVEGKALAPSLETLDGKTVYLVDGRFNGSGAFMQQVEGWLAAHAPNVKTRQVQWREPFEDDPEASREISENADAAILGVGI